MSQWRRDPSASLLCFQIEHAMAFNLHTDEDHLRAAKKVISDGVDVHYSVEYGGRNALMLAVSKGFTSLVLFFLQEMGMDIECCDNDGRTALHIAVIDNNIPLTKLLLDHGASLEAKTKVGNTALLLACAGKDLALVQLLVCHGAGVAMRNVDGEDAVAIALRSGNDEVVKFLDPNIIIPKKRQVTSTMFMQIMRDMMEHEMEQENMNGNQLLYGADTLTELDHESIAVAV